MLVINTFFFFSRLDSENSTGIPGVESLPRPSSSTRTPAIGEDKPSTSTASARTGSKFEPPTKLAFKEGYQNTDNFLYDYFVPQKCDTQCPTAICICIVSGKRYSNGQPVVCNATIKQIFHSVGGMISHLNEEHGEAYAEYQQRKREYLKATTNATTLRKKPRTEQSSVKRSSLH